MKFIYRDNSKGKWIDGHWESPIILEVIADNITYADGVYVQVTQGMDPKKQAHVGCSIEPFPA